MFSTPLGQRVALTSPFIKILHDQYTQYRSQVQLRIHESNITSPAYFSTQNHIFCLKVWILGTTISSPVLSVRPSARGFFLFPPLKVHPHTPNPSDFVIKILSENKTKIESVNRNGLIRLPIFCERRVMKEQTFREAYFWFVFCELNVVHFCSYVCLRACVCACVFYSIFPSKNEAHVIQ